MEQLYCYIKDDNLQVRIYGKNIGIAQESCVHEKSALDRTSQEADRLTREVESVDRSIDGLVYQLSSEEDNNMG